MGEIIRNGNVYGTDTAAHVKYDNTTSELEAENVQDAIDELINDQAPSKNMAYSSEKVEEMFETGYITRIVLPSNTDLDDITEPGCYRATSANVATFLNCPINDKAIFLEVMVAPSRIIQRIFALSSNPNNCELYMRLWQNGIGWYEWSQFANASNLVNPNLIDNPWFTVNQREKTTATVNNEHVADRWKVANVGGATIKMEKDTLIIDPTSATGTCYIRELFDNAFTDKILGKTLTLSILFEDGTVLSGTSKISGSLPATSSTNYCTIPINDKQSCYFRIYNTGLSIVEIYNAVGSSDVLHIKAVKLELGSVSTLAMDTAPDYATELAKCQRYFYKVKNKLVVPGYLTGSGKDYSMCVNLPTTMRAEPKVSLESWSARTAAGGYSAYTLNQYKASTKMNVVCFSNNDITIKDSIAVDAVDVNNSMLIYTLNNLELSADL